VLKVSFVNPTLDRSWLAHEWLSSADIYRSSGMTGASNNLGDSHYMQKLHIPSAAAAIHLLCRMETKPDLVISNRSMMDALYLLEDNIRLTDKFLDGLPPSLRCYIRGSGVITELLPYCLWLLSAGQGNGSLNRAVSSIEVLTKEEKIAFNAHVAMLRALGLTYVKADHGHDDSNDVNVKNDEMRLEPEVDKIVQFQSLPASTTTRDIIPSVKKMLRHKDAMRGMSWLLLSDPIVSVVFRMHVCTTKAVPDNLIDETQAVLPGSYMAIDDSQRLGENNRSVARRDPTKLGRKRKHRRKCVGEGTNKPQALLGTLQEETASCDDKKGREDHDTILSLKVDEGNKSTCTSTGLEFSPHEKSIVCDTSPLHGNDTNMQYLDEMPRKSRRNFEKLLSCIDKSSDVKSIFPVADEKQRGVTLKN